MYHPLKKRFLKSMIIGFCGIAGALHCSIPFIPQVTSVYAAETDNVAVDTNGNIGLTANLFCTSETGDANNVALNWGTTLEAEKFILMRSTQKNSDYETIYEGDGVSFSDYDLSIGKTYYYQLEVVTSSGRTRSGIQEISPCTVSSDLDLHSNQTGGGLSYETSGTKIGDTYYSYSMRSSNNEYYLVERTSSDGVNFNEERTVINKDNNSALGSCKLESVQMKYVESANKMIIWAHWEQPSGYSDGKALVITGTPGGEFTVHNVYRPLGIYVRDMTIFLDDDNTGYLVAASNEEGQGANATIYIFKMNDTYSDVTEVVNKVHENQYREFPNMIKQDGYYYLFTSQAAGWYPSRGGYAVTNDLGGTWSDVRSVGNTSTFSSQSGWILSLGDQKNHLMHAYRWLKASGTSGTTLCPLYFDNGFAFYDYYPAFRYSTKTGDLYPVQYGKLVSQDKEACASVAAKDDNDPHNAFDGSYQSSFTANSVTWPFYLQVDLETVCDLANVQTSWHIHKGSEGYYTYKIEGSTDGINWTTLLDRTNTSEEIVSNTYGFSSDLISGKARYVRLQVQNAHLHNNTNNWYTPTVYEVKVFGTPTTDTAEPSPAVKYDFEQDSSSKQVSDVSGNNQTMTLYGNATCQNTSDKGNVLYLDGSSGTYASLPNGLFDNLSGCTISMDVKSESDGNFFTLAVGDNDQKYIIFKVGKAQYRFNITSNSWSGESGLKTDLDGTTWHNYTLVLNGSVAKLYLDGKLYSSTASVGTSISDLGSNVSCSLGKSPYSSDSYFKGYIDNLTIYKQALSPLEVGKLTETEHSYGDWKVSKEATCTTNGQEVRTCSTCGAEETRDIETTGHSIDTTTWKSDSDSHWHICSVCEEKSDSAEHSFEWIVDLEPTTSAEGKRHQECSVCGYVGESETIPVISAGELTTTEATTEITTTTEATTEIATTTEVTTEVETTVTTETTTETATTTEATTEIATTTEATTNTEVTTEIETSTNTEATTSTENTTEIETSTNTEATTSTENTTEIETSTNTEVTTSTENTTEIETSTNTEVTTSTENTTEIETSTNTEVTTSTENTTETETSTNTEATTSTENTTEIETSTNTEAITSTENTTEIETSTNTEATTSTQAATEVETTVTTEAITSTQETTKTEQATEIASTTRTETTTNTEATTKATEATTRTTETTTQTEATTQTTEATTENNKISVTRVVLSLETLDLEVNDTATLTATVFPTNADNQQITWSSSNKALVSVDQNGLVTAKSSGMAVITVTTKDGGKIAECIVTIKEKEPENVTINVTDVSLSLPYVSLKTGESTNLIAVVSPSNATNKELLWKTSNASIATVDNGKITALNEGSATITVVTLDGEKSATCEVEVSKDTVDFIPIESVTLNQNSVTMIPGEQISLSTTILPKNATQQEITWTSINPSVVTVNANGQLTAVSEGTAVIVATAVNGGKSAYCAVTVSKKDDTIEVTNLTLTPTNLTLTPGESQTLSANIQPSNATNQTLVWSSNDNKVATVDNNGKVTAVGIGVATISVQTEDGSHSTYCTVQVNAKDNSATTVAVTNISVNPETVTLSLKQTKKIQASVIPSNATAKTITYTSANSSVATVSSTGTIKAVAPGITTIKVKAGSITKNVTVKVKPAKVTSFKKTKLSKTKIKLNWKKQSNVTGYKVYRYNTKTKTYKLYKITKTNYVSVANLKKNTTYKFKVKAYKRSGKAVVNGPLSNVYTVKMK